MSTVAVLTVITMSLTGCGTKAYSFEYDMNRNNSSFSVASTETGKTVEGFASDLCVTNSDVTEGTDVDMSQATAAGLFDIASGEVMYAKNIHEKLNPASLTKVMTALCALKYGNLDDVLTASANVKITESGAVLLGLSEGDTMTMEQALHALLLKSANDVAVMIAEHIGGSVEGFAAIMNEEAKSIGATNSHFVNPNGLTDPNHYTTAYDLYLIMNEAVKYDKFIEIIHTSTYKSVYHDKNGSEKTIDLSTTNAYIKSEIGTPDNVTVIGGKTGTTIAAGSCLIIYARDNSGNPYISIVMQSVDRTTMYIEMTDLLDEI
jgi:D-alanyl-D-alanine carboxypeptidase (penicillin-binding protein 5/6)